MERFNFGTSGSGLPDASDSLRLRSSASTCMRSEAAWSPFKGDVSGVPDPVESFSGSWTATPSFLAFGVPVESAWTSAGTKSRSCLVRGALNATERFITGDPPGLFSTLLSPGQFEQGHEQEQTDRGLGRASPAWGSAMLVVSLTNTDLKQPIKFNGLLHRRYVLQWIIIHLD